MRMRKSPSGRRLLVEVRSSAAPSPSEPPKRSNPSRRSTTGSVGTPTPKQGQCTVWPSWTRDPGPNPDDTPGIRREESSAGQAARDRAWARVPREDHEGSLRSRRSAAPADDPEDLGGLGGGAFDIYRVSEEMAGDRPRDRDGRPGDLPGHRPDQRRATKEQKAEWLGELAEKGQFYAYGATEPQPAATWGALDDGDAGRGERQGRRLQAERRKQWISNGGVADRYTILANAPGGPTWFLVDKGTEGFSHGKPEDKHGNPRQQHRRAVPGRTSTSRPTA